MTDPTYNADAPVKRGDVLAGKYEVESVLGVGGMGIVVSARRIQLGGRVALKFLLPHTAEHPEVVARFLREAQAASRIKSEHVARVIDVGELDNGAPYMVMEYLEGFDLDDVLERYHPLNISTVIDWTLQAMEALAEAHAQGIVHRDLKPANLFLTQRADDSPLIKVLDFGVSKFESAGRPEGLTLTARTLGSPLYMAPEQIRSSKHVDARVDIWSLGITLYKLLAGVEPFQGDSPAAVIAAIITEQPQPLLALRPDVPVELEQVILRCLEQSPTDRYGSVAELSEALSPFGGETARFSAARIRNVIAKSQSDPLLDKDVVARFDVMKQSGNESAPDHGGTVRSATERTPALPVLTPHNWGRTEPNGRSRARGWFMALGGVAVAIGLAFAAVRYRHLLPISEAPAKEGSEHPSEVARPSPEVVSPLDADSEDEAGADVLAEEETVRPEETEGAASSEATLVEAALVEPASATAESAPPAPPRARPAKPKPRAPVSPSSSSPSPSVKTGKEDALSHR